MVLGASSFEMIFALLSKVVALYLHITIVQIGVSGLRDLSKLSLALIRLWS